MFRRLLGALKREPDFIIGGADNPYMRRWWVIPRNRLFNVYLHNILRDDDDRALHDHPWANCSIPLRAGFLEVVPNGSPETEWQRVVRRYPFVPVLRRSVAAHRLVLRRDAYGRVIPAWSLFITGPKVRSWGFWCPFGWRHWKDFVAADDKGAVGRGCN